MCVCRSFSTSSPCLLTMRAHLCFCAYTHTWLQTVRPLWQHSGIQWFNKLIQVEETDPWKCLFITGVVFRITCKNGYLTTTLNNLKWVFDAAWKLSAVGGLGRSQAAQSAALCVFLLSWTGLGCALYFTVLSRSPVKGPLVIIQRSDVWSL